MQCSLIFIINTTLQDLCKVELTLA